MVNKSQSQPTQKNNFLMILVTVFLTVALLAFGGFGFWFLQEKIIKKPQPSPSPLASSQTTPIPTVEPTVESDPSAISEPTPPVQTKSDSELIREVLAAKHGKPLGDTIANISKIQDPYAQGGVKFEGEIGGAWFLAYKTNDGWVIVEAGNGTVTCETIEPYNFPVDMVPECWSEIDGLVVR